jgi:hypothetical protein
MEAWEPPSMKGVMLCPLGNSEAEDQLEVRVAAGSLRLASIALDTELYMCAAICSWTDCVTRRPYAVAPDFVPSP